MSDEKKTEKTGAGKLIELVRRQAEYGRSTQARRLLKNTGAVPRRFRKVAPKPGAVKE